jgi:hypothetical protein
MVEGVQNHTPEVMVIDEIGRADEVEAARTCKVSANKRGWWGARSLGCLPKRHMEDPPPLTPVAGRRRGGGAQLQGTRGQVPLVWVWGACPFECLRARLFPILNPHSLFTPLLRLPETAD